MVDNIFWAIYHLRHCQEGWLTAGTHAFTKNLSTEPTELLNATYSGFDCNSGGCVHNCELDWMYLRDIWPMNCEKASVELESCFVNGVFLLHDHIEENEDLLFNANRVTILQEVVFVHLRDEAVESCVPHGTCCHLLHAAKNSQRCPFHHCCSISFLHSTCGWSIQELLLLLFLRSKG